MQGTCISTNGILGRGCAGLFGNAMVSYDAKTNTIQLETVSSSLRTPKTDNLFCSRYGLEFVHITAESGLTLNSIHKREAVKKQDAFFDFDSVGGDVLVKRDGVWARFASSDCTRERIGRIIEAHKTQEIFIEPWCVQGVTVQYVRPDWLVNKERVVPLSDPSKDLVKLPPLKGDVFNVEVKIFGGEPQLDEEKGECVVHHQPLLFDDELIDSPLTCTAKNGETQVYYKTHVLCNEDGVLSSNCGPKWNNEGTQCTYGLLQEAFSLQKSSESTDSRLVFRLKGVPLIVNVAPYGTNLSHVNIEHFLGDKKESIECIRDPASFLGPNCTKIFGQNAQVILKDDTIAIFVSPALAKAQVNAVKAKRDGLYCDKDKVLHDRGTTFDRFEMYSTSATWSIELNMKYPFSDAVAEENELQAVVYVDSNRVFKPCRDAPHGGRKWVENFMKELRGWYCLQTGHQIEFRGDPNYAWLDGKSKTELSYEFHPEELKMIFFSAAADKYMIEKATRELKVHSGSIVLKENASECSPH